MDENASDVAADENNMIIDENLLSGEEDDADGSVRVMNHFMVSHTNDFAASHVFFFCKCDVCLRSTCRKRVI